MVVRLSQLLQHIRPNQGVIHVKRDDDCFGVGTKVADRRDGIGELTSSPPGLQQGDVRRLAEYPAAGLAAKIVGPVVDDDSTPDAAALPDHGLVTTEHLPIGDIPSRDYEDQPFAARGWQPLQGAAD